MSEQVFILRVENARELMVSVWRLACQFLESCMPGLADDAA